MDQPLPRNAFSKVAGFVLDDELDIPESTLDMAATLLLDTIGVAAGASSLDAGRIARDVALDIYGAGSGDWSAPLLFDGRRASIAGAAYAVASQIDNLDAHDGYNPTRGHIGCAVVPALFAFAAKRPELSGRDALKAFVVGYEIAARAALALHSTVSDYHTSGAWNALGVAAMGCRLMDADPETLREALGIAEYHGPRSQMMREIDNPTMLHDGSGMGALIGVSAVIQASRGFTGAPAITVEADEVAAIWADLGDDWTTERNYIKPYPICRWAHAAIDAVWMLKQREDFSQDDVASVTIRTFRESSKLYGGMPQTTSQAQYSLPFSVATMLVHGRIGPEHVQGPALGDPVIAELLPRIDVAEDDRHSVRFPDGRWSDVTITLSDGRSLYSGDVNARGGPEAPMSPEEIREKFGFMADPVVGAARAGRIWETGRDFLQGGSAFSDLADLVYPAVSGNAA